MKIMYDKNQLESAVHYIKHNNPHANNWSYQYIRQTITEMFSRGIDEEITFVATMGATVMFTQDVPNEVYADVTVDPSVGDEPAFVTEEM